MLMTSGNFSKIIDAVVRSASTLKSGRSGSSASGHSSSRGTTVDPGLENISSGGDTVGNVCDDRELDDDRDADDASSSSGASGYSSLCQARKKSSTIEAENSSHSSSIVHCSIAFILHCSIHHLEPDCIHKMIHCTTIDQINYSGRKSPRTKVTKSHFEPQTWAKFATDPNGKEQW